MSLPPLREELSLLPGPALADGQPSWTLHDPIRHLFFRIDWPTFEILSRWPLGDADVIVARVTDETTLSPSPKDVEEVVRFLTENQLLQPVGRDGPRKLAERLEKARGTWSKRLLHNYLFFRVPLVRPDGWLNRWRVVADLFYTRTFAVMTGVALLLGLALVVRDADKFLTSLVDTFTLASLVPYAIALFSVKLLHELGHAFTAKRFGCRIPAMGVAFLVLFPMAYTDTNETWRLTSRWQRLQVASAGIATELVIAAWATLAWGLLPDGGLRGAAFVLATTSWVATVAINASPFLRFDGYFILCDWLDMPNLHGRSFALARWKLREWLFRLDQPKPEYFSSRKETALILFAVATWIYRLFVFFGIAILVYHFFIKIVGIFLFVVEIAWFIVRPIAAEVKEWRLLWPLIKQRAESRGRARRSMLLLAVVIVATVLVPMPGRLAVSGILRPSEFWPMFVPAASQIEAFHHADGQRVKAGDELARFSSMEIRARQALMQARLARLRLQAATASLSSETLGRMRLAQEEAASAEAEYAGVLEEIARLTPLAPFAGQLRDVAPDLEAGQFVSAKERLAVLIGDGGMLVETYLDENEVKRVRVGHEGIFTTDGLEGPVLQLRLVQVDADATRVLPNGLLTAAAGGHILTRSQKSGHVPERAVYRVVLEVVSKPGSLAGQAWRGHVVIRGDAEPLALPFLKKLAAIVIREAGL